MSWILREDPYDGEDDEGNDIDEDLSNQAKNDEDE
jgi:hypothetical protein